MSCRICLVKAEYPRYIFGEKICETPLSWVLEIHFWFKVEIGDGNSEFICNECFNKILEFHEFYSKIKFSHEALAKKSSDTQLTDEDIYVDPLVEEEDLKREFNLNGEIIEELEAIPDQHTDDQWFDDEESDEPIQEVLPKKNKKSTRIHKSNADKTTKRNVQKKIRNGSNHSDADELRVCQYFDIKCYECEIKYSSYWELSAHFKQDHPTKTVYLRCCNRKLFNFSALIQHIEWHEKPEDYSCVSCNRVFYDKSALSIHMADVHTDKDKREFACSICDKVFARQVRLDMHVRESHIPDIIEGVSCDQCDAKFNNMIWLNKHVKRVHIDPVEQVCDTCGKVFKSKAHCRAHYVQIHGNVRTKCEKCGTICKSTANYRKHILRQHGEPVSCTICQKVCNSSYVLKAHMRLCHSTRQFKCQFCEKDFAREVNYKEHIATHTGIDLYSCAYCSKTFKSHANAFKHKKHAHAIEWEQERLKKMLD